jgi:hypothetical protein
MYKGHDVITYVFEETGISVLCFQIRHVRSIPIHQRLELDVNETHWPAELSVAAIDEAMVDIEHLRIIL